MSNGARKSIRYVKSASENNLAIATNQKYITHKDKEGHLIIVIIYNYNFLFFPIIYFLFLKGYFD